MASDTLPQTVTLTHDIFLLAAPYFGAPALACCPAGMSFQPLSAYDGFVSVQYQQHNGFLPAALCRPDGLVDKRSATHITMDQPTRLWSSLANLATQSPPFTVSSADPLLILGQDGDWLLLQRRDGQIGFLAPKHITGLEDRFIGPPVGCGVAINWLLAGFGWAVINWIGVLLALARLGLVPLTRLLPASSLVIWIITIIMWCGPRRDPERIFIVGLLMLDVLLLITFLPLLL